MARRKRSGQNKSISSQSFSDELATLLDFLCLLNQEVYGSWQKGYWTLAERLDWKNNEWCIDDKKLDIVKKDLEISDTNKRLKKKDRHIQDTRRFLIFYAELVRTVFELSNEPNKWDDTSIHEQSLWFAKHLPYLRKYNTLYSIGMRAQRLFSRKNDLNAYISGQELCFSWVKLRGKLTSALNKFNCFSQQYGCIQKKDIESTRLQLQIHDTKSWGWLLAPRRWIQMERKRALFVYSIGEQLLENLQKDPLPSEFKFNHDFHYFKEEAAKIGFFSREIKPELNILLNYFK